MYTTCALRDLISTTTIVLHVPIKTAAAIFHSPYSHIPVFAVPTSINRITSSKSQPVVQTNNQNHNRITSSKSQPVVQTNNQNHNRITSSKSQRILKSQPYSHSLFPYSLSPRHQNHNRVKNPKSQPDSKSQPYSHVTVTHVVNHNRIRMCTFLFEPPSSRTSSTRPPYYRACCRDELFGMDAIIGWRGDTATVGPCGHPRSLLLNSTAVGAFFRRWKELVESARGLLVPSFILAARSHRMPAFLLGWVTRRRLESSFLLF